MRIYRWVNRHARKLIVGVVGGTVALIGLVLFVTPIPVGVVLVPLGVIILASEFALARLWLERLEQRTGPLGRSVASARRFMGRRWAGVRGRAA